MRILANKWRESIDVHGSLTFYVDAQLDLACFGLLEPEYTLRK